MLFPPSGGAVASAVAIAATEDVGAATAPREIVLPAGTVPLGSLPADHPALAYLAARGFDWREIEQAWSVGYCAYDAHSRPEVSDRLIIPVYGPAIGDDTPALVGWQARRLQDADDDKKYLNAAGFSKSSALYGLARAGDAPQVVVVTEGVTKAWRLGSHAVAIFGKEMSTRQCSMLLTKFAGRPIVIAYDRDAVAKAQKLQGQLLTDRRAMNDEAPVVVLDLPNGRDDLGDCARQEAWAAIAGALEAAAADSASVQEMLPPQARIHFIDGQRKRLQRPGWERVGAAAVVAFDVTPTGTPALTFAGGDGIIRRIIQPSAWWREQLAGKRLIYPDALAAQCSELGLSHSLTGEFDDVSIMQRILGELAGPCRNEPALVAVERVRRLCDVDDLRRRVAEENLDFVYDLEKQLIPVVVGMFNAGLPVNRRRLEQLARLPADQRPSQCETLLQAIDPWTGRVHHRLEPLGAVTGRFACREPNLLGLDRRLRAAVNAMKGHQFIEADFSQFELRIAAQLSHDENLLDLFRRHENPFQIAASHLLDLGAASAMELAPVKRAVISMIYCCQPAGLARILGISQLHAQVFFDDFRASYPSLFEWQRGVCEFASRNGFTETLWGRRRRFSTEDKQSRYVNSVVQGTAADLFKLKLLALHSELPAGARVLLPIHDAVLIEAPASAVSTVVRLVDRTMTAPIDPFTTPLAVKIFVGTSWAKMQSVTLPN